MYAFSNIFTLGVFKNFNFKSTLKVESSVKMGMKKSALGSK
jgi:hypothetical protein